jgi:predicted kinase
VATSQKTKSQDLLVSVAESIGSTLGAIAAKADAAKDAIVGGTDTAVREAKREATKLVRKGKSTVANARRSKPARPARSTSRTARVTARKVARKAVTKARGAARKAKRVASGRSPRRGRR